MGYERHHEASRSAWPTLNPAEGVGRECRCLVRDQEQAHFRDRKTADVDCVCGTAKCELPVIADDGVDADPGSKRNGGCPSAINIGGTLRWVELDLVGAGLAAHSAYILGSASGMEEHDT